MILSGKPPLRFLRGLLFKSCFRIMGPSGWHRHRITKSTSITFRTVPDRWPIETDGGASARGTESLGISAPVAQFLDASTWQPTYAKLEIGTSWRKKRKKRRSGFRLKGRFVRDPGKNCSQIYSDLLRFGQIWSRFGLAR